LQKREDSCAEQFGEEMFLKASAWNIGKYMELIFLKQIMKMCRLLLVGRL
jgi:hypothetical protein